MFAHAVARAALLLFFALAALPGFVSSASADSPESADVRVIYWVDKTLGASYVANVMLTNMTPQPIESWGLAFDLDPAATNIRNAQYSIAGTRHTVTGAGWTRIIPAGGSIWFSIDGTIPGDGDMTTAGDVPRPTDCGFNGQTCAFEELNAPQPNPQDTLAVDIGWWVASQGVTDYRAQILLKNISDQPIDYWNLKFQSTSLITSIEHGEWSRTGTFYEVKGKGWTHSIEPDSLVWLTLSGVHTGQVDTLQSCIFNGFPCEFVDPDDFVKPPEEPEPVGPLCSVLPDPDDDGSISGLVVDFQRPSLWNGGYVYSIQLLNESDKAIRNWKLEFDLSDDMTIDRMWNADFQKSGNHVTVYPMPYNNCIEPGGIVGIGFEGKHDGGAIMPQGCLFNNKDCTFARISGPRATNTDDAPERPDEHLRLLTPYPNPFATVTRVPFAVAETQEVTVALWDMQGRQVRTLYSGTAVSGQIIEVQIPAGSLNSGVYMVRLTGASGAGVTTPVMLVR
ncbi:MAG: cellulose binding domain-containing protein [Rhodothermales bacterium]|nr:cellulose binding domain-containing protein [Rhodothermales bacterium]MBO6778831.1 cellulose binding domain-containing protein [Rhodothermales bacterium]